MWFFIDIHALMVHLWMVFPFRVNSNSPAPRQIKLVDEIVETIHEQISVSKMRPVLIQDIQLSLLLCNEVNLPYIAGRQRIGSDSSLKQKSYTKNRNLSLLSLFGNHIWISNHFIKQQAPLIPWPTASLTNKIYQLFYYFES